MADTGWLSPTAYDAGGQWTNPANGEVQDGAYASTTTLGKYQDWYNWRDGSSHSPQQIIPSGSTINGLEVQWYGHADNPGPDQNGDNCRIACYLYNGSSSSYSSRMTGDFTDISSADAWVDVGGAAVLWGKTWAYSDLSDANLYVELVFYSKFGGFANVYVDVVQLKIYYTAPVASNPSYCIPLVYTVGKG